MKRLLICFCTLTVSALTGLARAVGICDIPLTRRDYFDAPTVATFNEVRRRDLLEGQMPAQATRGEQATRTTRDQRPSLKHFTLARNEFAF